MATGGCVRICFRNRGNQLVYACCRRGREAGKFGLITCHTVLRTSIPLTALVRLISCQLVGIRNRRCGCPDCRRAVGGFSGGVSFAVCAGAAAETTGASVRWSTATPHPARPAAISSAAISRPYTVITPSSGPAPSWPVFACKSLIGYIIVRDAS